MYQKISFLTVLIILALTGKIFATHIVGADLRYEHLSGLTYKVTVALYGDCGSTTGAFGTLPTSSPQVCVYNGSTLYTTMTLLIDSPSAGTEVTPLCSGDTSNCTTLSSIIPGIKKFVYSDTVVLPSTSAVWRFIYDGSNPGGSSAGRSGAITNVNVGGGSMLIQLIDTLNNISADNSSPDLTVAQQTFFCLNQSDTYYPGAWDPDGDSINITLTTATNGTGACGSVGSAATYLGSAWPGMPTSPTEPVQVMADSFAIDSSNGLIAFYPNALQRDVVVYNIREYRSGVFIGASQREMTVLVLDCSVYFPCMLLRPLTTVQTQPRKERIYPNPAINELTIDINAGQYASLAVVNTLGQTVLSQDINTDKTKLDIHSLPVGLYYITLKGDHGSVTKKFVKQ